MEKQFFLKSLDRVRKCWSQPVRVDHMWKKCEQGEEGEFCWGGVSGTRVGKAGDGSPQPDRLRVAPPVATLFSKKNI
jgi:hypothetical protein